ncbi:Acetyltransferase (GNAT) family protein [Agrococcus baldri]|uniref:Acetyltransferase (GNAT) family protein n=1 Tax=Agrococcus baldri TaxID=153730 RepID=A0AA94KZW5_9MICO|nr:GNAT family N-acetyltransferase [Agrococcus baldri]SFS12041.1 Acetyltransferase (GNAT) family protein [Agrococcus baldri]
MELRSPASTDEALRWLRASTFTIDTPANRARLAADSLERTFDKGHRRPDLVWAATEGEHVRGLVAARDFGEVRLVDVLCLPDDQEASAGLLRQATEWALPSDEAEVSFGGPAERPLEDPRVQAVLGPLAALAWRVLVTRRHYELPSDALTARATPGLRLERAAPGDEDRLASLLERVLPGSLDVRDQLAVAEHGLEIAAQRWARELLQADPIDCIRFAVEESPDGRRDAGMVSWITLPSGTGLVLQVGVAEPHRGRGLGRELVAAATAELLESGAHTLIADTDDANVPMQRAFAAEGWHATESRIDLHLP